MPLILAIEPDRRQAAQLTGLIRHHTSAELVLADTTARAIDAIGQRVPDLVLVHALLSPQDDAALAAALRVVAGARDVQMLTIPVLGAAKKTTSSHRVLSILRREHPQASSPDGCDPTVFAEQIASYLERGVRSDEPFEPAVACEEQPSAAEVPDAMPETARGDEMIALEEALSSLIEELSAEDATDTHQAPKLEPEPPPEWAIKERTDWGELIESLRGDLERLDANIKPRNGSPPAWPHAASRL